jgi:hypothetical protein
LIFNACLYDIVFVNNLPLYLKNSGFATSHRYYLQFVKLCYFLNKYYFSNFLLYYFKKKKKSPHHTLKKTMDPTADSMLRWILLLLDPITSTFQDLESVRQMAVVRGGGVLLSTSSLQLLSFPFCVKRWIEEH